MKNLRWLALISVIVAIVILPAMFAAYEKFYEKPFVSSLPGWARGIVNPNPFLATWYGISTLIIWIFIGSLWVAFGLLKLIHWLRFHRGKSKVKSRTIGICLTLVLSVAFVAFAFVAPVKARWNYTNVVDVLCMGDEEFMAHSDWVTNAQQVLQQVNEQRFADFKIQFCTRGWINWDSNDAETFAFNLYQEAIQECGLPICWIQLDPERDPESYGWGVVSGSDWRDSNGALWWIDLLLVFTGQYMEWAGINVGGLSIPTCNATIIRYDCVRLGPLVHELGHQYTIRHCDDSLCVMNAEWMLSDNFCPNCRDKLNANRDKWMTDPMVYFISRIDQGQFVSPVDYTDFIFGVYAIYFTRVKCGTTATVRTEPLDGWILDYYYARNTPWTYTSDPDAPPPPSFTVYAPEFEFTYNDTWTVVAYFNETGAKINEVKAENGNPAFKRGDFTDIRLNLTWDIEDQPMAFIMNITDSCGQMISFVGLCCERYVIGSSQIWFGIQIPYFAQPGEARIDCSLWTDWPWEKNARRYGSEKIVTIEIT